MRSKKTNTEGGMFLRKKSLTVAKTFAHAAREKIAKDTIIMDLEHLTLIADYFVITHGESSPQLKAISNHISRTAKNKKIRLLNVEGKPETGWILLDFGDVIVHIFSKEKREFYNLEYIWQEAKLIDI